MPSPAPGSPTTPRVVLFARAGCHLCAAAREVVQQVTAEHGEQWAEVDVDAGGATPDGRSLAEAYGELLPVVEVDGVRVGYWQIDPHRLGDALTSPR